MLSLIRKNASSIWIKGGLFVVASTFLFFFGMSDVINKITGNDYVIKVGNVKIGPNMFKLEARKQMEKYKKLGITDEAQLMNIAMNHMIDEELTSQMMRRYGIMVDNDLVKLYMYSIPMFRDKNGSFNKGAVRAFMSNMQIHEAEFVDFLRRDIQSRVLGTPMMMSASRAVVSAYITSYFEKRTAKYFYIPFETFSVEDTYTDEDLEACLKNNADKFMVEEKRDFELLTIAEADIMKDITVSDEAVAEEYKARGETVDFDRIKDVIHSELVKAEYDSKLNELIRNIEDDFAAGSTCDEIAQKYKLNKASFRGIASDYVSPANSTTALPTELMKMVMKAAFALEAGQESSFVEGLDKDNKKIQWLVHTNLITPAHPKPLAEEKNEVIKIWRKERQIEDATSHVKAICDNINLGVAIDFEAEKYGYKVTELKDVTRTDKASSDKFKGVANIDDRLLAKICGTAALHSDYVLAENGVIVLEVMSEAEEKDIDKEKAAKLGQKIMGDIARDMAMQLKEYNKKQIGVKINHKLLNKNADMPMPDVDF